MIHDRPGDKKGQLRHGHFVKHLAPTTQPKLSAIMESPERVLERAEAKRRMFAFQISPEHVELTAHGF